MEIKKTINIYKKIVKHLKGHIVENNYDNLDIIQLELLENEIKRLDKLKTGSGIDILAIKAPKSNKIWDVSNPNISQSKAIKYLGPNAELYLANDNKHKYKIFDPNINKWIKFGSIFYEDYTKHKDFDRMKRYISRATNIKGDWKNNPYSKNMLSIKILW
jgi:hypothetical protein